MAPSSSSAHSESNEVVVSPSPSGSPINLNEIIGNKKSLFSRAKPVDVLIFEDGLYTPSEPIVIHKPLKMMARNSGKAIIKNENLSNLLTFTGDGKLILSGILFVIGNPKIQSNTVVIKSGSLEMSGCGVGGAFDPKITKRDFGAGLLLLGDASATVSNTVLNASILGISLQGNSSAKIVSCNFSGNGYGLVLRDKAHADLQANEFETNHETGVMVYDKATLNSSGDSSHNNKQGIGFLFESKGTVEDAKCYQNQYHGFFINDSSQVTLKGCKSYSNAYSGIAIYGDSHSEVQDCECYENAHSGFEIAEQAKTLLRNNKVYKNHDAGIYLDDTAEAQIVGNEIFENSVSVDANGQNIVTIDQCKIHHNSSFLSYNILSKVNQGDNEVFENDAEEDEDEDEAEGENVDLGGFLARLFGGASVSSNDDDDDEDDDDDDDDGDDDDDDDDDDEDEGGGSQNLFFGIGQDGEVTNMTNEGGGFSLSFTLDQDGEEIPEARCPKCNKKGTHVWDPDNGIYKCDFCDNEFVPEIYKALDSAEEYVNRAWRNFKQRNYKRTIQDCTSAIRLDPNMTLAYTIRGKAHSAREDHEEAEKDYSEAIRISPDDDNAHFSRGETRLYLEKYDEAIEDLSASIGFDPNFATTYFYRALAYINKEDYPRAIQDLSDSLQREPDNSKALCERGNCYVQIGEDEIALADYTASIELEPDNPEAFMGRAELHEKHERYQEALTDYKNFLRSAGGEPDPEIIERLNALQLKIDPNAAPFTFDPDEEVSIWEDVTLDKQRKEDRSQDHGRELLEKGDLDGAYKEFSAYIKNVPDRMLPYIYRACVSYKAGKLEDTIKDLTSATECGLAIIPHATPFSEGTDPRYKNIYLMRAFVYSLLDKQEEVQKDLVNHLCFTSEKSYLEGVWSRHTSNFTAVEALSGVFARTVTEKAEETRTPLQNAILALIEDDRDSALQAIEEAVRSDPNNPVNFWVRGLSQDELDDTFKDFATATELAGGIAEHFYIQGFKKLLNNRIREGREDLLKAISLDPNNAEYHEKLGVFLSKNNQHDEAIQHLTRAIELNPDSKDAYYTRGVSLDWKGETEAALADLEKAIALEAKTGNVKTKVVQEKIQEIKDSEAKKQTLLSKIDPSSEKLGSASEYIARGEVLLKAGKWEPAYVDFNEAIKLEPNNANAYRFRGATYYKLGDAKSALKDYNQAITLDPKNSDLFLNRGILQADSGDSQNALVDLDEAIRLNPKNAMAYHMRARVYSEAWFDGDSIDHALEDFEQAIKLDPNDPEVYVSRAQLWCQPSFPKGKKEALADYDQAIRLTPDNAEYYLARHKIKLSLKDANGAAEDLTKAYQLDPTNEEVKELVHKLTAGDDKHSQVVRLMMSAQEKINADDLAGAIEDLKKASESDPDDESVKNILSQIPPAMLNGESNLTEDSDISEEDRERANQFASSCLEKFNGEDYEGCIEDLSQAITLYPALASFSVIHQLRGLAKFNLGQNEAALIDYSEAIRLEPNNAGGYLGRSLIHLQNESYDKAIADFDSVLDSHLELDENNKFDSYYRRGYAKLQIDLISEAIPDLSQAIMLRPDDPDAYFYRAKAYKELHNYKSAISDYQVVVELTEDDDEDINEALGFIEEMSKSLDTEPSLALTPILSPEPKKVELANVHILRAYELKESRDFAGALKEAQLARYLIPDVKLPYELAFAIYNDMEDWENGISNLLEVLRIAPNDVGAYTNLGALKTKVGDLDGAVADLVKATKLDPKHAQSHLFLGVAYLMQSKYAQAKESLTRSIDLDPSVPVAYLHRASTKEKLKDYVAAVPDFEKYCALGGSPEVPDLTPLREHIEYLKKEYGVPEVKQDEGRYSIVLKPARNFAPGQQIEVIKLLRKFFSVGLVEAKNISEKETVIGTDMTFDEASSMVRDFKEIGADAQLVKSTLPLDVEIQRSIQRMKQLAEQNLMEQKEQNRKQTQYEERKQKLQKEIDEHNLKLEELKCETGSEIERLRKERESLGFLAMAKKKEIDQKIAALERSFMDFSSATDSLRQQLKNLKP